MLRRSRNNHVGTQWVIVISRNAIFLFRSRISCAMRSIDYIAIKAICSNGKVMHGLHWAAWCWPSILTSASVRIIWHSILSISCRSCVSKALKSWLLLVEQVNIVFLLCKRLCVQWRHTKPSNLVILTAPTIKRRGGSSSDATAYFLLLILWQDLVWLRRRSLDVVVLRDTILLQ